MIKAHTPVLKLISCIVLVACVLLSSSFAVLLSDQGSNVRLATTQELVASADLGILIYTNASGGELIYNATFTSAIVNGSWNVLIDPPLVYGRIYWKDYTVNGEDLDYGADERLSFQSNGGLISDINSINFSLIQSCPENSAIRQVLENGSVVCLNLSSVALNNETQVFSENVTVQQSLVATSGFFTTLGSLLQRIGELFVTSLNVGGSIAVGENVSAQYFIGDGSLLTGINISGANLTNYYSKSQIDDNFSNYLLLVDSRYNDTNYIDSALLSYYRKADVYNSSETYTQAEVDSLISSIAVNTSEYYNKTQIDQNFTLYVLKTDQLFNETDLIVSLITTLNTSASIQSLGFYNSTQVDALIPSLVNYYTISDVYNKTEIEANLSRYLLIADARYNDTSYIDSALANYYLKSQTYNQTEVDTLVAGIDLSAYYNKTEIDQNLTLYVLKTDQRFNETGLVTSLINMLNTTVAIQSLGFYNMTQVDALIPSLVNYYTKSDVYNTSEIDQNLSFFLRLTDQRFNETNYIQTQLLNYYTKSDAVNQTQLTQNLSAYVLLSDQRFNETSAITILNTTTAIQALGFYNTTQVDSLIPSLVNYYTKSDVYNKTEVEANLSRYLLLTDARFNDTTYVDSALVNYYLKSQTYNQTEVDTLVAGIDLSAYYNKTEIDQNLTLYVLKTDQRFNETGLVTSLINTLNTTVAIQSLGFYNTTQVDALIPSLVNYYTKSDVYNITEIEQNLSFFLRLTDQRFNETSYVDTQLANYYNRSLAVNQTQLAQNLSAYLFLSDQRFNETSAIAILNTTSSIQSLGFYNTTQVNALIPSLVNYYTKSDVYNKTEIEGNLSRYLLLTDSRYNETGYIDSALVNYYLKSETYNQTEVDLLIAGVDFSGYYNKTEIDQNLTLYVLKTDQRFNETGLVTSLINTLNTTVSIQSLGFYNTTQVNALIPSLVNYYTKSDVYNRTEIEQNLSFFLQLTDQRYNETSYIQTQLGNYYTKAVAVNQSQLSQNLTAYLLLSDQRFNETSAIAILNTTASIQALGFYNTTQVNALIPSLVNYYTKSDVYNKTEIEANLSRYLLLTDSRYNDTPYVSTALLSYYLKADVFNKSEVNTNFSFYLPLVDQRFNDTDYVVLNYYNKSTAVNQTQLTSNLTAYLLLTDQRFNDTENTALNYYNKSTAVNQTQLTSNLTAYLLLSDQRFNETSYVESNYYNRSTAVNQTQLTSNLTAYLLLTDQRFNDTANTALNYYNKSTAVNQTQLTSNLTAYLLLTDQRFNDTANTALNYYNKSTAVNQTQLTSNLTAYLLLTDQRFNDTANTALNYYNKSTAVNQTQLTSNLTAYLLLTDQRFNDTANTALNYYNKSTAVNQTQLTSNLTAYLLLTDQRFNDTANTALNYYNKSTAVNQTQLTSNLTAYLLLTDQRFNETNHTRDNYYNQSQQNQTFLMLNGSNAQDILNLSDNNISASTGFFSWLGSTMRQISSIFVVNVTATGNISAEYFIGNASALVGFAEVDPNFDSVNSSLARSATCPAGTAIRSISATGFDCINATHGNIGRAVPMFETNWSFSQEFLSATSTALDPLVGNAISSGSLQLGTAGSLYPGVVQLRDSATANGGYRITTDVTSILIAGGEQAQFIFRQISARSTMQYLLGFFDTTTVASPTDGCWIRVTTTDGNKLQGMCASNSATTNTSSSYNISNLAWYTVNIYIDPTASSVNFSLYNEYNNLVWTDVVSSDIPTGSGRETGFGILSTESTTDATANMIQVDYAKLVIEGRDEIMRPALSNLANIRLSQEFLLAGASSFDPFTGTATSSGTIAAGNGTIWTPGVAEFRDSTNAAGNYRIMTDVTSFEMLGNETGIFIFKHADNRTTNRYRMGFHDSTATTTLPTDGCWFDVNGGNMSGICASASTRSNTSVNYTLTHNEWYKAIMQISPDGSSAEFNLYTLADALLWSQVVNSNLPIGASQQMGFGVLAGQTTADAANTTLLLDYMEVSLQLPVTR